MDNIQIIIPPPPPFDADEDEIYCEFGSSPLGKGADLRGSGAPHSSRPLPWSHTQISTRQSFDGSDYAPAAPAEATALPQDQDLYSDLFGDDGMGKTLLQTQLVQLQDQLSKQHALIEQLQSQLETLNSEKVELQSNREALSKNISALFNTAKLEIQRKDDQIKELRDRLAKVDLGHGGRPSTRQQQGHSRGGPAHVKEPSASGGNHRDLGGRKWPFDRS